MKLAIWLLFAFIVFFSADLESLRPAKVLENGYRWLIFCPTDKWEVVFVCANKSDNLVVIYFGTLVGPRIEFWAIAQNLPTLRGCRVEHNHVTEIAIIAKVPTQYDNLGVV